MSEQNTSTQGDQGESIDTTGDVTIIVRDGRGVNQYTAVFPVDAHRTATEQLQAVVQRLQGGAADAAAAPAGTQ